MFLITGCGKKEEPEVEPKEKAKDIVIKTERPEEEKKKELVEEPKTNG